MSSLHAARGARRSAAGFVAALLSACASPPTPLALPPPALPARFGEQPIAVALPVPSAAVLAVWGCLDDPVLTGAVERALQSHPDIALANARVEQAESRVRLRQADRQPSLGLSANAARQRTPEDERFASSGSEAVDNRFKATFTGRWDLDVSGRLALAASAETALWAQARAQADDTRRRVAANAAIQVLQLRSLQHRLEARKQALEAQRAQLRLAERRQAAGLAAATDAARLRTSAAQSEAVRASLQRGFRESLQDLSRDLDVTATTVQRWLENAAAGVGGGCTLDPGLPGDLLTRRADLLAAYQGLVAAVAERGASEAGRRPNLVLDSALGWSAVRLSGLSGGGALLASLGATLDLRLFDFGRIQAEIDRSRAAEREAWLRYAAAARQAVAEVESAMDAIAAARAEEAALDAALAQQARVVQDSRRLATAGLADARARLEAEQAQALLHEQRSESRFQWLQAVARLIQGLGAQP